ncbi:MAG: glycoside hydrolase family 97 catalytic domain-containing protein [Lachnospiraceae bacterium]|nr:glycoside hydrolase family 97 catalytic domain-containing protein [Lachnospiraceae bacterium]
MVSKNKKTFLMAVMMLMFALTLCSCKDKKEDNEEVENTEENSKEDAKEEKKDLVYTDGAKLEVLTSVKSLDGDLVASILKDDAGRVFYSVTEKDVLVIEPSMLGIITGDADFTKGAEYVEGTTKEITDEYTLLNGKHDGGISDKCNEYSFTLKKDGKELTVNMRVYDEGIAYNYAMSEGATVKSEASEFVFKDESVLWSYTQPNVTYEGTYVKTPMKSVFTAASTYTVPSMVQTDKHWILLTEGSVFDDEETYASSLLKTAPKSKNLKWVYGNGQSGAVTMENAFETPWRIAIVTDDLNELVNSDIVTSVCADAYDVDYSFVKPGKLAWSWWSSTGDNPIAFEPQYDYIDFAAENGWEYVCLDYGWVLWDDYKTKVKELVDYAAEKNVGIWLWYGVNNVGHSGSGAYPKYSLLNEETIKTELQWANSIGIKGVKVDYYEKDNQNTMKQMYLCAKIAADNKIMVLFHGCTNPGGENRTFPNVLSYEAVYGAEYYKWRQEPSTANIITYLFTRNVVGSADFTPTALPVAGVNATHGFMLGTSIYVESGLVHFAENVNVYEGYAGLSFMNDMPVTWDETFLVEGMPGSYGTVARRSGNDWYVAALTVSNRETKIDLSFLEDGKNYKAYVYKTNEAKDNIAIEERDVKSGDVLTYSLASHDGLAIKITEEAFDYVTDYEKNYIYIEGEKATLSGDAKISNIPFNDQYSSGKKTAEYIGNGANNTATFTVNVTEAGVYELNVFYVSGNDRRFMISVNGDDANRLRTGKLNSGDWVSVEKVTYYVELVSGENTIKFYNDEAFAPNIDRIALSKSKVNATISVSDEEKDIVENSPGAEYEYTMYEAEKAVIGSGATNEGHMVGWLGGTAYVEFNNINVETAGTYYLEVWYMTGEDRDIYFSVNGGEDIVVKCPTSGDYTSNPACVYVEVELTAGTNTIKVSNPKGYAPNLDKIGVSVTTK